MTEPSNDISHRTESALPRSVDLGRWLWIAASIIGFLRSLYQLSDRARLVSQLHAVSPQMTQAQVDSAANTGIAVTIVFSLAVVALYVMFANQAVRGRNWARIVVAVLAGLSALGTVLMLGLVVVRGAQEATRITGVGVPITPVDMGFNVVVVVLNIATVVLFFRPDSNRFFREAAESRTAAR